MRHACLVQTRSRIAVASWLGGAVSILPFTEDWFGLGGSTVNFLLLAALASAVVLGFAIHFSTRLQRLIVLLAGPPEPRAGALVLVAVLAGAGALAMLAVTALIGSG